MSDEISKDTIKPLLGIKPESLWRRERMRALASTIANHATAVNPAPATQIRKWCVELLEHANRVLKIQEVDKDEW